MSLPPFNLYYAEEIFNEPWQPITVRQIHQRFRRVAIVMAALTFAATFAGGAALDRLVHVSSDDRIETILIAAGQANVDSRARPPAATPSSPVVAVTPRTVATRPVARVAVKSEPVVATVAATLPAAIVALQRPVKGVAKKGDEPLLKPARPPEVQVSNKAVESAPGSRFAISRITATEVHLVNGVRVKVGGRFPNGEEVVALDPARNRVETSSRVMVVLPETDDGKQ